MEKGRKTCDSARNFYFFLFVPKRFLLPIHPEQTSTPVACGTDGAGMASTSSCKHLFHRCWVQALPGRGHWGFGKRPEFQGLEEKRQGERNQLAAASSRAAPTLSQTCPTHSSPRALNHCQIPKLIWQFRGRDVWLELLEQRHWDAQGLSGWC